MEPSHYLASRAVRGVAFALVTLILVLFAPQTDGPLQGTAAAVQAGKSGLPR